LERPLIITRSPLRISLGGGGTDLPSYYREHGGFVVAAAIDKYVYITVHQPFANNVIAKYSKMEVVDSAAELKHPIIREALRLVGLDAPIEITSMSDIPAGSGLGSSGSFTTALLQALHATARNAVTPRELAEEACHIEIDLLGEPIGRQDQYIAAFGGITAFNFCAGDKVEVRPVRIPPVALSNLEDNLILFFTGYTRSASGILNDQDVRSRGNDKDMLESLHFVKQLGYESCAALEGGDLRRFAEIMHVHWESKRARSRGITNPVIDQYYELARANGALGGKLIGAGGGGFLMFYTEDKTRLRTAMTEAGLREIRTRFDFEGARLVEKS
jgi:D-glycero-alpha-D-manno-heptose-7-phosphate kinase